MTDLIFEVIERERALEGEPVTEANACLPGPDAADTPSFAAAAAVSGLISVDQLDGVPLFYERAIPHPEHRHFSFDPTFRDECVAVIRSVKHRVPDSYGALKRITTAGTFVNKPGQHGLGRAMDHDRWTFEHVAINPIEHDHTRAAPPSARRYWALAAIMRSHSAFLLHGHFNDAHATTCTTTMAARPAFSTTSEATVKLVQAICKHIHGKTPWSSTATTARIAGPRSPRR